MEKNFIEFKNCLDKKLIRQHANTNQWISKELKIAEKFLKQAKGIKDIEYLESSEIAAYESIFHSTRALLYHKGYKERSHFCLFVAIGELYKENPEIINLISIGDQYRSNREAIAYDGLTPNEKEVDDAINLAIKLLETTKKYLGV